MISTFGVGCNDKKTKNTTHKFKINFMFSTILKDGDDTLINGTGLKFISFKDILFKTVDAKSLAGKCSQISLNYFIYVMSSTKQFNFII